MHPLCPPSPYNRSEGNILQTVTALELENAKSSLHFRSALLLLRLSPPSNSRSPTTGIPRRYSPHGTFRMPFEGTPCTYDELLEILGFLLNSKKCITEPSQIMECLGFMINLTEMTLSLPEAKVSKIWKECRHALNQHSTTGRKLAHLIGPLSACIPAILEAPLHYRALQRLKYQAVGPRGNRFDRQEVCGQPATRKIISIGWNSKELIRLYRVFDKETRNICATDDGQSSSHFLHQQDGRCTLSEALQPCPAAVELVHTEVPNGPCRACTQSTECNCRLRKQTFQRF